MSTTTTTTTINWTITMDSATLLQGNNMVWYAAASTAVWREDGVM